MIQAFFSQIRTELMTYIENSSSDICLAVAWFTHRDLFQAILNALDRNVKVSIILIDDIINRGPNGLEFSTFLTKGGQIRFMNARETLMHNKFCLFDGKTLITGSYNWTYSAESRNAENIIATDEENVCRAFREQFNKLWNDLPLAKEYNHVEFKDVESKDLLICLDSLRKEYESMEQAQITTISSVTDVDNLKKDISIIKFNTVITTPKQTKPSLLKGIGQRCRINGVDGQTFNIVKQGQELPYTNTITTYTIKDFQKSIVCNIVYGNFTEADKNESLLKLEMDNLPQLKAGEVHFSTRITIDTNGYMHVRWTCHNTGVSKIAIYNVFDKIIF